MSNVVEILKLEHLYSRSELKSRGESFADSASSEVIKQTSEKWKDSVRFYFRPQTPTFYNVEGLRPKDRQKFGVQCPMPVYLLFDFENIICHRDSRFSNGNLAASDAHISSTSSEFEKLPFQRIYHVGSIPEEQKRAIVFHRNAEVIVPKEVGLEHLKRIWCRSEAERDTLRHLLGESLWDIWKDKITNRSDHSLFFRQWIYVDTVEMSASTIRFRLNPCHSLEDAGPYDIRVEIRETKTGAKYLDVKNQCLLTWNLQRFDTEFSNPLGKKKWNEIETKPGNTLSYSLRNLAQPDDYSVQLFVDDQLVFASRYVEEIEDIPF